MRFARVTWAIATGMLIVPPPSVAATTRPALMSAGCPTAIVFGAPQWREQTMTFRVTVDVACPLGVAFTAALRSSSGCEMRSSSGAGLRYELFSDPAMHVAVVSCERSTQSLSGTGRQNFVMYGRVEGPVVATGEFHDALLTSITR